MALDTAGAASIVGGVASLLTAGTGAAGGASSSAAAAGEDPLSLLIDLREHDVPFYQRCSIDLDIRVGCWYSVTPIASNPGVCRVVREKELMMAAEPRILAFDIETTKAPLMFPNASFDCIYMLSMVMGEPGGNSSNPQGVLLINREVVGGDVPDFEYSPSKGAYLGYKSSVDGNDGDSNGSREPSGQEGGLGFALFVIITIVICFLRSLPLSFSLSFLQTTRAPSSSTTSPMNGP